MTNLRDSILLPVKKAQQEKDLKNGQSCVATVNFYTANESRHLPLILSELKEEEKHAGHDKEKAEDKVTILIGESDLFSSLVYIENKHVLLCDVDPILIEFVKFQIKFFRENYPDYKAGKIKFEQVVKSFYVAIASFYTSRDSAEDMVRDRIKALGPLHFLFNEEIFKKSMEKLQEVDLEVLEIDLSIEELQNELCKAFQASPFKVDVFYFTNLLDYPLNLDYLIKNLVYTEDPLFVRTVHDNNGPLKESDLKANAHHYVFVDGGLENFLAHLKELPHFMADLDIYTLARAKRTNVKESELKRYRKEAAKRAAYLEHFKKDMELLRTLSLKDICDRHSAEMSDNFWREILYTNKSNEGDKRAQYELGWEADDDDLIKLSADQGYSRAEYRVGIKALNEWDFKTAIPYLTKAAEHGSADAHFELAKCYLKSIGVKYDVLQAMKHLVDAYSDDLRRYNQNSKQRIKFNERYFKISDDHLYDTSKNGDFHWYIKNVYQRHPECEFQIAKYYQQTKKDEERAQFWFMKAAELGHFQSLCIVVPYCEAKNDITNEHILETIKFQRLLANRYVQQKENQKAVELFIKIAEKLNPKNPNGPVQVKEEKTEPVTTQRRRRKKEPFDYAFVCYKIAILFETIDGLENLTRAKQWYTHAHEAKHESAAERLKFFDEIERCHQEAKQENPNAQYKFGQALLDNGELARAIFWLEKATSHPTPRFDTCMFLAKHYEKEDLQRSAHFYVKAVQQNKLYESHGVRLASEYERQGQFEKAIECAKRAISREKFHETCAEVVRYCGDEKNNDFEFLLTAHEKYVEFFYGMFELSDFDVTESVGVLSYSLESYPAHMQLQPEMDEKVFKFFKQLEQSARESSSDKTDQLARAHNGLARCYLVGCGVEKDEKSAFSSYVASAACHNTEGWYGVGMCYEHGIGVPKDAALASENYEKAAAQNHGLAHYGLGFLHEKTNQTKSSQHFQAAFNIFEKEAEKNSVAAYFYLACCYFQGRGVETNSETGMLWLQRAAENEHLVAQYRLVIRERNESQERWSRSKKWIDKSASHGYPFSLIELDGPKKSREQAIATFANLSNRGYKKATFYRGYAYFYHPVDENQRNQGWALIREAKDNGVPEACAEYAAKEIQWMRKDGSSLNQVVNAAYIAARSGIISSQLFLANDYYKKRKPQPFLSLFWLTEAAMQGSRSAKESLEKDIDTQIAVPLLAASAPAASDEILPPADAFSPLLVRTWCRMFPEKKLEEERCVRFLHALEKKHQL